MSAPGSASDVDYLIGCLQEQGERLAAAAERAGLARPVPTCPGWTVSDLVRHTGFVHRWATEHVAGQLTGPAKGADEAAVLRAGPADSSLLGWFGDGHAALVTALRDAPADLRCWTFLDAPSPLAFWARRQAHETAIHRSDAEWAAGRDRSAPASAAPSAHGPATGRADGAYPGPAFDARLAADGVDELLMGFGRRAAARGRLALAGSPTVLGLHAVGADADQAADWLIASGPGGTQVTRGAGRADGDVTGPASDLYLLLWNRGPAGPVEITGDARLLDDLTGALHVTWS